MSNRLLWILIIIWFIWAWYLYYNLSYLKDKNIALNNEKILNSQTTEIKKEPELIPVLVEKIELSNSQKIDELKEKTSSYKVIKVNDFSKAIFIENWNWLSLSLDWNEIWNFDLVDSDLLRVESIYWTDSDLYLEIWDKKYYYRNSTKNIYEIDLNINIIYVKNSSNDNLIIVTEKWSFTFNISSKKAEYFSFFNDFIYYNDWYIWLVKDSETRILKNIWINSSNKNSIIYYNPNTKEKKLVHWIDINIKYIFERYNKIYFIWENNEIFELINI